MQGWRVVLNPIQLDRVFKHASSLLLSQVGNFSQDLDGPRANTLLAKRPVTVYADSKLASRLRSQLVYIDLTTHTVSTPSGN